MTDFPRLVEHAFPLKQTSLDSVHEKNVRHGCNWTWPTTDCAGRGGRRHRPTMVIFLRWLDEGEVCCFNTCVVPPVASAKGRRAVPQGAALAFPGRRQ